MSDEESIQVESYVVSMADCVIVDDFLPDDNVMLAEVIDYVEGIDCVEESQINEGLQNQIVQPCLPAQVSISALYTAIDEKDWEEARELIIFSENERLFKYKEKWNGWTSLHRACFHRSIPMKLFHDLISRTLDVHDEIPETDKWGDTALHVACQHSTEEMILLLLENCSSAARIKNKHGGLPLHAAVHYECTKNVLHELLKVHHKAIHVPNNYGNSPLHHFLHSQKYIYAPAIATLDSVPLYGGDKIQICLILKLLLQASQNIDTDYFSPSNSFHLLHSAINASAPLDFVKLILAQYPEEISAFDSGGNMPIHIAVALTDKTYQNSVMKLFVSEYPQCVRIPNKDGRLPISILTESNPSKEILSLIFNACTFVSGTRDMETHLYPFLSLLCDWDNSKLPSDIHLPDESENTQQLPGKDESEEILRKITNSYMILIENPAVLRGCQPF